LCSVLVGFFELVDQETVRSLGEPLHGDSGAGDIAA
jgi:hypothetical protein